MFNLLMPRITTGRKARIATEQSTKDGLQPSRALRTDYNRAESTDCKSALAVKRDIFPRARRSQPTEGSSAKLNPRKQINQVLAPFRGLGVVPYAAFCKTPCL
jgi:hypothetical protein